MFVTVHLVGGFAVPPAREVRRPRNPTSRNHAAPRSDAARRTTHGKAHQFRPTREHAHQHRATCPPSANSCARLRPVPILSHSCGSLSHPSWSSERGVSTAGPPPALALASLPRPGAASRLGSLPGHGANPCPCPPRRPDPQTSSIPAVASIGVDAAFACTHRLHRPRSPRFRRKQATTDTRVVEIPRRYRCPALTRRA